MVHLVVPHARECSVRVLEAIQGLLQDVLSPQHSIVEVMRAVHFHKRDRQTALENRRVYWERAVERGVLVCHLQSVVSLAEGAAQRGYDRLLQFGGPRGRGCDHHVGRAVGVEQQLVVARQDRLQQMHVYQNLLFQGVVEVQHADGRHSVQQRYVHRDQLVHNLGGLDVEEHQTQAVHYVRHRLRPRCVLLLLGGCGQRAVALVHEGLGSKGGFGGFGEESQHSIDHLPPAAHWHLLPRELHHPHAENGACHLLGRS
mmetsp:Transcript_12145/g.27089  ORF Transcript_12145/g.27089 Transcript_12145/m.27089 type:complete len:257 (-) Transcript_12145:3678-4448(-)